MNIAELTEWERKQLDSIELLLKQAIKTIDYFVDKDKSLRDVDTDEVAVKPEDWLKFRGIVVDLHSALDYVWYLLYCHFSNCGLLDLSDKGCTLGFPYKKKGIKCSNIPGHDQTGKFVKDKLEMIWSDRVGKQTHFWKEMGDTLLSVQPKMTLHESGKPLADKAEIRLGDEESFALLHFYRNCSAHKDLITFMPKKSWVEINQTTRETKLVTEKRVDYAGYFYKELDKGLWIQLPGSIPSSDSEPNRLLVDVLKQLQHFVVSTVSRLLRSALLIPSAKGILENHLDGCTLTTDFKVSNEQQEATVTATMKDGKKIKKIGTHMSQVYAEEAACVQIIRSLSQTEEIPNSPYSHFVSHCIFPFPGQIHRLERMPDETYEELLDDWKKKLQDGNMKVDVKKNEHNVVLVVTKDNGEVVFKVCSDNIEPVQRLSAKEANEAAAYMVILEGVRLGLIAVVPGERPRIPTVTLVKSANKTFRMVLNEYKQKVDNSNMIATLSYSDSLLVAPSTYESELSLTIVRRKDNVKIEEISSDKHREVGKSKSLEAAAHEVLKKCIGRGLITLDMLPNQ